ncbi:hypothetical protein THRCLA_10555 [Thraustotheca clavata]|uniref:Uncharacterized protein n=1 Tax=Thraustotheca clavata TaxID=74557 RepID=A0A1V9YKS5_9STRA|nr:hypothetical protein THRCLA_10555 [Thraustotheca clavata]
MCLFIVDIWVSIEFVTRAIFRLDQLQDVRISLLACFYLSPMLWLAYGALMLLSFILKKIHKERIFNEADPTLTALAVMITTGPITNLQSHFSFHLFAKDENSNESALPVIMFCLTIGMLPIIYGLFPGFPTWCRGSNKTVPVDLSYGSFKMNDIKHRFTHYFALMSLTESALNIKSGSMYQLFDLDRKFKRNLGMSQRGADCYLLFGCGKQRTSF